MFHPNQVVCDCANQSAHCLHDGKPGEGIKCMARDNWYTRPCDVGQCPMPGPGCCGKPHPDAWMEDAEC